MVAFDVRLPLIVSAGLVGLFAVLHGQLHCTELLVTPSPVGYAVGFVGATLLLHAIGVSAVVSLKRPTIPHLARLAGSGTAAAGLLMLAQLA